MIRFALATLLGLGLMSAQALSQTAPKIFVASTGNDANDGGRATPKRSFQAAHNAVAAGGEIVVLDTAGYGAVTITKSVGIVVPQGITGFVTVTAASTNGITIGAAANDVVTLRGLIIEGTGPGLSGGFGINATAVGTLIVEDTSIRGFFAGINVFTNVNTKLFVRNGSVRNTSYGVFIQDSADNTKIDAVVSGTEFTKASIAIAAKRQFGSSQLTFVATRCLIGAASLYGVYSHYSGSTIVDGCTITGSATAMFTEGAEAVISNSTIANNATAFAVSQAGENFSRGNNTFRNNTTTGPTPTPLADQ